MKTVVAVGGARGVRQADAIVSLEEEVELEVAERETHRVAVATVRGRGTLGCSTPAASAWSPRQRPPCCSAC